MKVQNKLRLGFGFLFVVVLFFGIISVFYVNEISGSAKIILKDNYETLNFVRKMRVILDESTLPLHADAVAKFEYQLQKEEQNLTERGEPETVKKLRTVFTALKTASTATLQVQNEKAARRYLLQIEVLNMNAIVHKNDKAQASVKKAVLYLGLAGTFTFLVLFSFSVNFPGFIAAPIHTLLEGIREISHNNYRKRIHFNNRDEFAVVAQAFNEMAVKLNEWENSNLSEILSQKLRIETIIEQMQDAIIGVNEQQEVLFINTSAKNILKLHEQKPAGKLVTELVKNNDLFRLITEEKQLATPFKIVLNGKDAYFQLETREILVPNMQPNYDKAFNIAANSAGRVYLLRNITEFKERDEAKTNFIATISHELKTPISAIKLSLKLLADRRVGELNPEQEQLVLNLNEDAGRLLKITSELLDLAQAETGNIRLNFSIAQPEQVMAYAIKAIQFEAEQKGVVIEQLVAPALPSVQVDTEKTAWVMINFLSNALRYSAADSRIIVQISAYKNVVEFSVKDFGKGIEKKYQQQLFDRYFRVPTDGPNKFGYGLGLAISKDFITAEGGQIGVESDLGEGCRFYFQLPAVTDYGL